MMLDSLKKYDASTANGILAAIALSSTNPGVGSAAEVETSYVKEREEVLAELRAKLHLGSSVEINEARLSAALAEQMRELALAGKDQGAILDRAGQAGRLLPDLYSVTLGPDFQTFVGLGTRVAHVENAIRQPTIVQHFTVETASDAAPFSLFLQMHSAVRTEDSFWLAIVAQRQGRTLIVHCAVRVYLGDVELETAREPIDVLRAFAEKFGFNVTVGKSTGKFIVDEVFPRTLSGEFLRGMTIKGTLGLDYFGMLNFINLPDRHQVVMGFAINITRYAESLRFHGVKTSGNSRPSSKDEVQIGLHTFNLPGGLITAMSQRPR